MDRIIIRCYTITLPKTSVNGFLPSLCVCLCTLIIYIPIYSEITVSFHLNPTSNLVVMSHEAWTFLIVCNMNNIFSENNLNSNLTMIIYGWSKKVLFQSDNTSKMAISKRNSVKLSEMVPFPQNQLNFLNNTCPEMICDQINWFTALPFDMLKLTSTMPGRWNMIFSLEIL